MLPSMGGLVEELLAEASLGFRGFGHHQQSAGVFVDTVYQSHLGTVGIKRGKVFQIVGDRVDKRAREVAGTGMDDHPCRLVDHHQSIVFIDHGKRYVFGHDACVVFGTVEHQRDNISGPHLIITLHRPAVDTDETGIGCTLYAVAALVRIFLGQKLVYAYRSLPGIHFDFPMLVELPVTVVTAVGRNAAIEVDVFQFVVVKGFCHIVYSTTSVDDWCCEEECPPA